MKGCDVNALNRFQFNSFVTFFRCHSSDVRESKPVTIYFVNRTDFEWILNRFGVH